MPQWPEDEEDTGRPEGLGKAPSPQSTNHGSKLRGISLAAGAKTQLGVRRPNPEDGFLLDNDQLVTFAVECGFPWDSFGRRDPAGKTLEDRPPTDAEALFSLFPSVIPFAIFSNLYGGSSPTLLWSDLGRMMNGITEPATKYKVRLSTWWKVLQSVRSGLSGEVVGEPVSVVLTGSNWDSQEWSLSLDPQALGGIWTLAPRHQLCEPCVVLDKDAGHRTITKLGFAQAMYFHGLHLLGAKSGELYSPEDFRFEKVRKVAT